MLRPRTGLHTLILVSFFMALGATLALGLVPFYPESLASKVAKLQDEAHDTLGSSATRLADLQQTSDGLGSSSTTANATRLADLEVVQVSPTEEDCNPLADCVGGGGIIPSQTTGDVVFTVRTTPESVKADLDYVSSVKWEPSELGGDPRSRSALSQRMKLVETRIPFDDIATVAFAEDFNDEYQEGMERYVRRLLDDCGIENISFTPQLTFSVEKPECLQSVEPYELESGQIDRIVRDHFNLGIMLESDYNSRRLPPG